MKFFFVRFNFRTKVSTFNVPFFKCDKMVVRPRRGFKKKIRMNEEGWGAARAY